MTAVRSSQLLLINPLPNSNLLRHGRKSNSARPAAWASNFDTNKEDNSVTLITFLGKGGSGKITSAIFAAQNYALAGLSTCLLLQTPDLTVEYIVNCKNGTSPVVYAIQIFQ